MAEAVVVSVSVIKAEQNASTPLFTAAQDRLPKLTIASCVNATLLFLPFWNSLRLHMLISKVMKLPF